jgi:hypothetical protein
LLDKLIVPALIFPILADVANKLVVVTPVAFKVPIVFVELFILVTLILVPTMLDVVKFVLFNVPVVTKVEKSPLPLTSSVNVGVAVPIPTLPPVVKIFPRVLELNVELNPLLIVTLPEV